MRRFLFLTGVFAAMVIVSLIIGEAVVRSLPNSYAVKERFINDSAADSVNVLVLGSSHDYYGIIPDSVTGYDVFNLANVSQNFEYDVRLLEQALPHMPRLHTVIVNVSYASFWDPPFEKGDEWWYEIYYRLYMDIDKYTRWSRYGMEMSKFSVFSSKIRNKILGKPMPGCDRRGYGLDYAMLLSDAERDSDGPVAAARHHAATKEYEEYNLKWAVKLLEICREHDLRVIFITTPAWTTYRDNLDSGRLDDMHALIAGLCGRYGAEYYDFMASPDFGPEDFHDSDHLSASGAARLSRILGSIIAGKDQRTVIDGLSR